MSKPRVLRYLDKDPDDHCEVVPWDSTRPFTSKMTGRRTLRHVIEVLGPTHIGLYVDGLGYIGRHDVGRRLVVDYDIEYNRVVAYIEDGKRKPTRQPGRGYQIPPTQFSETFPGIQALLGYERNKQR